MPQQPERFFARIFIRHVEGAELSYIYNRQDFDALLNIKKQEYDQSQFIEVGDIITLKGRKLRVENINVKMESQLWEIGGGYGINLYSPSQPTDYNFQIGIFVEDVE